mgnify:FL=1
MKPSNPGEKSFLTTKKKGNVIINPKKEDLMKETKLDEKKLDAVGKEDKDIDNDGDHDKSDRYLLNRRKVRSKVIKMREAAHDALRSRRAKKPQGEGAVDTAPDESNVGEETLHEISSKKLMDASKAAEKARGMRAAAGDTEGAKKALAQGKKFGDAGRGHRKPPSGSYKESADRMKAKMIQFTKDHDNILAGKQPI